MPSANEQLIEFMTGYRHETATPHIGTGIKGTRASPPAIGNFRPVTKAGADTPADTGKSRHQVPATNWHEL
jgi:hypothetical protein